MREIYNESAYNNAISARIKANASKTRAKKLDADTKNDSPEFRYWLGICGFWEVSPEAKALIDKSNADYAQTETMTYEEAARVEIAIDRMMKEFKLKYGTRPKFIMEAINQWGGLTEKQLVFARKVFAENVGRAAGRDAKENARRAGAEKWEAKRYKDLTATVVSCRYEETQFGTSLKALVMTEDGRKLWTSVASATYWEAPKGMTKLDALKGLTLVFGGITVTPADNDPTMGFGSRPTVKKGTSGVVGQALPTEPMRDQWGNIIPLDGAGNPTPLEIN